MDKLTELFKPYVDAVTELGQQEQAEKCASIAKEVALGFETWKRKEDYTLHHVKKKWCLTDAEGTYLEPFLTNEQLFDFYINRK